jgi:uncharacterized protein (DUF433 family)
MAIRDVTVTPAEASALLGVPEKRVRKDIEHGLFDVSSPPRLPFDALVYFLACRELDDLEPSVEGRRRLYGRIKSALSSKSAIASGIPLSETGSALWIDLGQVVKTISDRLESFERWKASKVATDPKILGGEPVFRGTRLSVRHIGQLADRETIATILEDYPYLSEADVAFARRYHLAYPRVGRPRESS